MFIDGKAANGAYVNGKLVNHKVINRKVADPKPPLLRRIWLLVTFRRWKQTYHDESYVEFEIAPPAGASVVFVYETDNE